MIGASYQASYRKAKPRGVYSQGGTSQLTRSSLDQPQSPPRICTVHDWEVGLGRKVCPMNVRLGVLDQVIPSRSGHQLISAQRSRRVVMALEGSPCGKAGLNGPNLVNINEVPASRTLSFDLRPKAPLESGIKIYSTMRIPFQAKPSA
jgi:hypothetical protein